MLLSLALLGCAGKRQTAREAMVEHALTMSVDPDDVDASGVESSLERKDWARAAERLERMLARPGLVMTGRVKRSWIHVAPAKYAIRRLATAGPEFLAAYRERFDRAAKTAATRDDFGVAEWERFFFATGMDAAGDRLAGQLFDAGCAIAALEIWTALLRFYPEGGAVPKAVLEARAMMAAALAGDRATLESLPIRADQRVMVGDREMGLEDLREVARRKLASPVLVVQRAIPSIVLPGDRRFACLWGDTEWRLTLAETVLLNGRVPTVGRVKAKPVSPVVVADEDRLLWAFTRNLVGVVELDPPRLVWMGPLAEAPLPRAWHDAALSALTPAPSR